MSAPLAGANDVHHLVATRDEKVGDQAAMAAPPERLGAHEAGGRVVQGGSERLLPLVRRHSRGVAPETRGSDAPVSVRIGLAAPPATELDRVNVRDAGRVERFPERRVTEMRVPS